MRTRATTRNALLLAAALLPAVARSLELGGRIGVAYQQTDGWSPGFTDRTTQPHFDLDLALDARGIFERRDIVNWRLAAAYRRVSDDPNTTNSRLQKFLTYSGAVNLFSGPRSPLSLSLDASRGHADFSAGSALNSTGASDTTTYGVSTALQGRDRPPLILGYRYTDSQISGPGLPDRNRTTQAFNAGTSLGNSTFNMAAGYDLQLNDGSWAADRFTYQNVNASAKIPVPHGQVIFDEHFQTTVPKALELGTFKQENNGFRAAASNGGSFGDLQSLGYSYLRTMNETFATPANEFIHQGVSYNGDLFLTDPTLFTRWLLDASLSQSRSGTSETRGTGETVGGQLWWRRQLADTQYQLHGGPLLGLVQTEGNGSDFGWGLTGSARAQRPWREQTLLGEYTADYGSNLYGAQGTALRQNVRATLAGTLGRGHYTSYLQGSAFRTTTPLFGNGAGRSLELVFQTSTEDVTFEARGTLEQGIAGSTPKEFVADGLFLPAPFNSTTRQVLVGSGVTLFPGLTLSGHFRYLSTDYPGQPTVDRGEVFASLAYRYGALVFALEDRVDRYQVPGAGWATGNLFIVRVFRSLTWR